MLSAMRSRLWKSEESVPTCSSISHKAVLVVRQRAGAPKLDDVAEAGAPSAGAHVLRRLAGGRTSDLA